MKKLYLALLVLAISFSANSQFMLGRLPTREQRLNAEYCSGAFDTQEGIYFDLINDTQAIGATSYQNVLDWLEGRVAGLQVYKTRSDVRIPFIRNSLAGIYVDEIWREPDFLNSLPVAEIAMIKVIKGPFHGGFNSPGGAIAIYTK